MAGRFWNPCCCGDCDWPLTIAAEVTTGNTNCACAVGNAGIRKCTTGSSYTPTCSTSVVACKTMNGRDAISMTLSTTGSATLSRCSCVLSPSQAFYYGETAWTLTVRLFRDQVTSQTICSSATLDPCNQPVLCTSTYTIGAYAELSCAGTDSYNMSFRLGIAGEMGVGCETGTCTEPCDNVYNVCTYDYSPCALTSPTTTPTTGPPIEAVRICDVPRVLFQGGTTSFSDTASPIIATLANTQSAVCSGLYSTRKPITGSVKVTVGGTPCA